MKKKTVTTPVLIGVDCLIVLKTLRSKIYLTFLIIYNFYSWRFSIKLFPIEINTQIIFLHVLTSSIKEIVSINRDNCIEIFVSVCFICLGNSTRTWFHFACYFSFILISVSTWMFHAKPALLYLIPFFLLYYHTQQRWLRTYQYHTSARWHHVFFSSDFNISLGLNIVKKPTSLEKPIKKPI